jgi:dimethylargininase
VVALVREVSPRIANCELTHVTRVPIDPGRASDQHHAYCQALAELGARVEWLAPLPQHADGVFVEDTAVVVDEVAIVARPGVASRRPETASMADALKRHRPLRELPDAGCLEGGDVMRVDRVLYVGRSARTNQAGIDGLAAQLAGFGYQVRGVDLKGCLHLKTACTYIPAGILLHNPAWIDPALFPGLRPIAVDPSEPYGANTLTLGGTTLVGAQFPRTRNRLEAEGIRTRAVDLSELAKAEGALTCSSVIVGLRTTDS